MKYLWALFLVFLIAGCGKSVSKEDLHLLNGYWQIAEVEFKSGDKKEYSLGNSVDFIHLEGAEGYRKKVQPNILGSFKTSDDAQNFEVVNTNNAIIISYKNTLSTWSETLIRLNDNSFAVINEEGTKYVYKRYQPINLSE